MDGTLERGVTKSSLMRHLLDQIYDIKVSLPFESFEEAEGYLEEMGMAGVGGSTRFQMKGLDLAKEDFEGGAKTYQQEKAKPTQEIMDMLNKPSDVETAS